MIKKLIKQLLCSHQGIVIETQVSYGALFIVRTTIKCSYCDKSFKLHPNRQCCYVDHMHYEVIQENLFKPLGYPKQPY